jgi:hypothetical protein
MLAKRHLMNMSIQPITQTGNPSKDKMPLHPARLRTEAVPLQFTLK